MQRPVRPFVVPVFIPHAGCPHRCIFCDQTRTTSQTRMLPALDRVHGEIRRYLGYRRDAGRFTEISFYGGNFLGLDPGTIQAFMGAAGQYIRRGEVQGIRFSTRPDTIDMDRVALIRDFPVTTVELGVQSMDDRLLDLSRRGHSANQIRRAVALLREHPWRLGLQMMIGLPGEDLDAALATAGQIAGLAPDFVRIYPTLVLSGSPLARWYRDGRFNPLTLDEAVMRAKAVYALFYKHAIPVVRMGLQPTAELNHDAGVVAGPFHPAFGELVRAALWRDVMDLALERVPSPSAQPVITLDPRLLSRVKGNKNGNVNYLVRAHSLTGIAFETRQDLPPDTILVDGRPHTLADHLDSA